MFTWFTARPDIQILVNAETVNGTHYQLVTCSAIGGRPTPQISWLLGGLPPLHNTFNVNTINTVHTNGTSTLSSTLRFPTHLQDEDSVTCELQHLTLPKPKLTTVRVETYGRLTLTAAPWWHIAVQCRVLLSCIMTQHELNQNNNFSPLIFHADHCFSLCSTYTVTDHKSHCAVQCIHMGVPSFSSI